MHSLSHLTCTPTKSNLYLASSLVAAVNELVHAPNISSTKPHVPFLLLRLYQNISPGPRLRQYIFRNIIRFNREELLAPRSTPKLEDHPLSAARDCLFNIFAATLHTGPFSHPQQQGRAMPW